MQLLQFNSLTPSLQSSITKIKKTPQAENKQAAEKSGIDEDVVKYIQNNIMQLPAGSEEHKIFTLWAETARTALIHYKCYEENLAKIPNTWSVEKEGNFRIPEGTMLFIYDQFILKTFR